jgi:hypothetical protein
MAPAAGVRVDEQLRPFAHQALHHGWGIVGTVLRRQGQGHFIGVFGHTVAFVQSHAQAGCMDGKAGCSIDLPAACQRLCLEVIVGC